MKSKLLLILPMMLTLTVGCRSVESPEKNEVYHQPLYENDFVPGTVTVKVNENLAEEIEASGTIAELPGSNAERLFADGGEFEERMQREGLHLWYKVTFDKNITLTKANNTLSLVEGVELIESRPKMSIDGESSPFNDPGLKDQWHYRNKGNSHYGLEADCDINVLPAWERGIVGNEKVIVAVIDTGVDYNHEDLKDNIWTNPETLPNVTYGYNFDAGNEVVTPGDHGTHVAGTISAINNNGIGVSGIAGGDAAEGIKGVRIMSCQIFSTEDGGNGDFGSAMVWAANHGAVIAQNSWNYPISLNPDLNDTPESDKVAIDYFNKYAGCDNDGNQLPDSPMKGGVVLFSAGNDAVDKGYPSSYEGCISVASVAGDFKPAYYTSYGDWVDIAAPGGDYHKNHYVISTVADNKYAKYEGTSMACPHVSGVAALVVSEFGGPGFTREMCIERLLSTSSPLKTNISIGRGLVNAADAVAHYGKNLPNNVEFAGYDFESSSSLLLEFIVPDVNIDVKCRKMKLYISKSEFSQPVETSITWDLAAHKPGDSATIRIDNLEKNTDYFFSTTGIDALGNESALSKNIKISTVENLPPVIEALKGTELTMKRFMKKSLDFKIYDSDNNLKKVEYVSACDSDSFKQEGDIYVLTIEGPKAEPGEYTSTIIATDDFGVSSKLDVHFTIEQNQAPIGNAIENKILIGEKKRIEIDLKKYFSHPDGDELKFTVSSDDTVASVAVSATGVLTIQSNSFGYADITVIASDTFNLTAQCTFKVGAMALSGFEVYPNPVTDGKLYIRSALEGKYSFSVINSNGANIESSDISNNPFEPYCLNVSKFSAGTYTVVIDGFSGKSSHKIIIF